MALQSYIPSIHQCPSGFSPPPSGLQRTRRYVTTRGHCRSDWVFSALPEITLRWIGERDWNRCSWAHQDTVLSPSSWSQKTEILENVRAGWCWRCLLVSWHSGHGNVIFLLSPKAGDSNSPLSRKIQSWFFFRNLLVFGRRFLAVLPVTHVLWIRANNLRSFLQAWLGHGLLYGGPQIIWIPFYAFSHFSENRVINVQDPTIPGVCLYSTWLYKETAEHLLTTCF